MGIDEDGLGDWRLRAVTRLTADLPPAFPGGPAHKAGTPVGQWTPMESPDGRPFGIGTPSTAALSLSLALKMASAATSQRSALAFELMATPDGSGTGIAHGAQGTLFDFVESCMACVVFSFHALEAFANDAIALNLRGSYVLVRKKKRSELDSAELERRASTEEKLGLVLPDLLDQKSPKGSKLWQEFQSLQELRDATVHVKSKDQYPKGAGVKLDTTSMLYRFLHEDLGLHVRTAVRMLQYFSPSPPRWLTEAAARAI